MKGRRPEELSSAAAGSGVGNGIVQIFHWAPRTERRSIVVPGNVLEIADDAMTGGASMPRTARSGMFATRGVSTPPYEWSSHVLPPFAPEDADRIVGDAADENLVKISTVS
jgi:hypothetical protein